ncbi:MAG TPA: DUF309 domain-containing protein [Nitrososphaerales archaeon]|nr:DUF309 domain-containing protein [Nitrososphaerales archaeon]
MRFLLRVLPDDPERRAFLEPVKSLAKMLGARVTHPRWTSYGALEVDVFTPSAQDFQLFVATLEPLSKVEFTRNLDEAPPFKPMEEVLEEARGYFNSERYWECHETLESVWRPAKGEEKKLVQAIILVCAALVHEQRGEREVGLGIYRRALPQIAWPDRRYHGIDVPGLRLHVERSLEKGELRPFKI